MSEAFSERSPMQTNASRGESEKRAEIQQRFQRGTSLRRPTPRAKYNSRSKGLFVGVFVVDLAFVFVVFNFVVVVVVVVLVVVSAVVDNRRILRSTLNNSTMK